MISYQLWLFSRILEITGERDLRRNTTPFLGEMYEEKEKIREIYEQEISSDEAFYN